MTAVEFNARVAAILERYPCPVIRCYGETKRDAALLIAQLTERTPEDNA